MKKINKRRVGGRYEDKAAAFLEKKGLQVIEKNFRCRTGEIDLIAKDGTYPVFVEVKYRHTSESGRAASAVDLRKQRVISRTAKVYLLSRGYGEDTDCRFDVIAFDGSTLRWIKNAFDCL